MGFRYPNSVRGLTVACLFALSLCFVFFAVEMLDKGRPVLCELTFFHDLYVYVFAWLLICLFFTLLICFLASFCFFLLIHLFVYLFGWLFIYSSIYLLSDLRHAHSEVFTSLVSLWLYSLISRSWDYSVLYGVNGSKYKDETISDISRASLYREKSLRIPEIYRISHWNLPRDTGSYLYGRDQIVQTISLEKLEEAYPQ